MPDLSLYDVINDTNSCVTGSLLGVNDSGSTIKVIPLFCHKWTCSKCRKVKSYKWRDIAVAGKPQRFITLTLKENKRLTIHYQARIIKKAFPKLVQKIRKEFGEFEYLVVYELTKKGTPHIHLLQRGVFIPKSWLSREWKKLTGAYIVDIKKIFNPKDVGKYLTKYMGKELGRASVLLSGMRVITKSGNWIIYTGDAEDPDNNGDNEDCFDWTFATYKPMEAIRLLIDNYGYIIDHTRNTGAIELHGPPTDDIIPQIMWPLIDR